MELRLLVLPGSNKGLKFPHGELMRLEAELAAADRTLTDLYKQPLLAAARYVQIGRAWEEAISLEDAAELVDQAKGMGVEPNDLVVAMVKTSLGRWVKITPSFDPNVEEDAAAPYRPVVDATAAKPEGSSKNVLTGVPFGKVS